MPMSGKKMTGNQDVFGGFDLDAFVGQASVDEAPSAKAPESPPDGPSQRKRGNSLVSPSKALRSAKIKPEMPARELLTQRVQVRMTDLEFKKLENAAGMVPVSTYVRKFLQDHGLI